MSDKWRGDGGRERGGRREGGGQLCGARTAGGKLAPRQRHVEMAAAADDERRRLPQEAVSKRRTDGLAEPGEPRARESGESMRIRIIRRS